MLPSANLIRRPLPLAIALAGVLSWSELTWAEESEPLDFFEKHIRPVLVEHCYKCHSAGAEKLQGKLLLDSRDASRKGGETGAAIVPGDSDASLLLKAIRYEDFEMPPSGKLSAEVIADFEKWIKDGAADPREGSGAPQPAKQIDFAAARQFWSFQPPRTHELPPVSRPEWLARKSDGFVLRGSTRRALLQRQQPIGEPGCGA